MGAISRRQALVALGGSAAVLGLLETRPRPAAAADTYGSNTELYAAETEGVDYGRRYRRHAAFDDSQAAAVALPETVIMALHGGGIEPGTSELCLAVAGYHPATMAGTASLHDYWMFEGLRAQGNAELHVTSVHCDDPVAELLVAGARRAVSLHGCTPAQAGLPSGDAPGVVVGGRDTALKARLTATIAAAGLTVTAGGREVPVAVVDGATRPALDGDDPANIVNRTYSNGGAQLELTTPLRAAMFGTNTAAQRKNTTTPLFWSFVTAVRQALA
ncbi:poly-gamma-glutamate hydrolase family protein [Actinoplanes sp. NPDC049316]|uniref:poly-gamma-glutamate hydrolase family protein n=1 Tax=Actinoplanes sp. NPDC049316 TaxID=3154727 RepID=UPI00343E652F